MDDVHGYLKPSLLVLHDSVHRNQRAALAETVSAIKSMEATMPILAVLPGAETGISLASRLSNALGTRSNDTEHLKKWESRYESRLAVNLLTGVRVPLQRLATSTDDIIVFWNDLISKG